MQKKNLKILQKEKNLDNKKFEIIKIPLPNPKFFRGTRVPASYMNFYITNKKVLVPTFRDVKDKVILKIFKLMIKYLHFIILILKRSKNVTITY